MIAAGRWLTAAALGLTLGGCASVASTPPSEPGAAASAVARDPLAARHREQAEALELRSGEVHAPIGGETVPG